MSAKCNRAAIGLGIKREAAEVNSFVEQGHPFDGHGVVAHWAFVYGRMDTTWATGEFLLRTDGTLLRRSGGSSYARGLTTYEFGRWEPIHWWDGVSDAVAAIVALKARGYELAIPGPTTIESSVAGPFPGIPDPAKYL